MQRKYFKEGILKLHNDGYSTREIANKLGLPPNHGVISRIIKEAGLKPVHNYRSPDERYIDEYIVVMAQRGETREDIRLTVNTSNAHIDDVLKQCVLTIETNYQRRHRFMREEVRKRRLEREIYPDIAKSLGVARHTVEKICIEEGLTYSEDEVRDYLVKRSNASQIAEKLKALNVGLEYVEGYTAKNKPMKVRKLSCGHVFEIQWHSLSQNRAKWTECPCPVCTEKVQSEKREAAKAATKMRQARYIRNCVVCGKALDGPLSITRRYCSDACAIKAHTMRTTEQLKDRFVSETRLCRNCGQEYRTEFKWRSQCCSADCAAAYEQTRKHERMGRRLKGKIVSRGITLIKIYNRDNGICQICGRACDWDDYHRDANNYFVIGKTYPTIDHIKPLAKGGLHEWNNVQLACFMCNSIKSDTYEEVNVYGSTETEACVAGTS